MICLKSNSELPCFQLNVVFRISLIEESGTNTKVYVGGVSCLALWTADLMRL